MPEIGLRMYEAHSASVIRIPQQADTIPATLLQNLPIVSAKLGHLLN